MALLGDMFGGIGKSLLDAWVWIFVIVPTILIIAVIIIVIKNKLIFKYKVRIFRTRENGHVKEANCKGGYINRKNNAPFFRIKLGKMWWQYVDLIETPKVQYMDEEDRVYYQQIDVGTYIQMRRIMDVQGMTKFSPVETDVKYGAILSVQRIKDILRTESTLAKLAPYFGLVLLAIVFIVAYSILMNKCSGGV